MQINAEGLLILKTYEGLEDGNPDTPGLEPYRDPIGIPTIGYGCTYDFNNNPITMDTPSITKEEAELLLQKLLRPTERYVSVLTKVPLNENQFSALVDLVYNIGTGNYKASTLRAKLNRGDYLGASNEFPKWRRSGGRILNGLVKRREADRQLFLKE